MKKEQMTDKQWNTVVYRELWYLLGDTVEGVCPKCRQGIIRSGYLCSNSDCRWDASVDGRRDKVIRRSQCKTTD